MTARLLEKDGAMANKITKESLYKSFLRSVKKNKFIPSLIEFRDETGIRRQDIRKYFDSYAKLISYAKKQNSSMDWSKYLTAQDRIKITKADILRVYCETYKNNGRQHLPTLAELAANGIHDNYIRREFGSTDNMHEYAKASKPELFPGICMEAISQDHKHRDKVSEDIKKYKRFFITTAVLNAEVDKKFLKSIRNYCKRNKAKLLVLTCLDRASKKSTGSRIGFVDKELAGDVVTKDLQLNKNFIVSTIKLNAKQRNPLTGLSSIIQGTESYIFAGTKQIRKDKATANNKFPNTLLVSGAVTRPQYQSDKYMSERSAYLAHWDHQMSGWIVEIEDDEIFYQRSVQAAKDGSFRDLNYKYSPDGKKTKVDVEAVVYGDYHCGSTCPKAKKMGEEVVKLLKPTHLVVHDFFDGVSVSHHEKHNAILRALRAEAGELTLLDELKFAKGELEYLSKLAPKLVMVPSNHDEFLHRYLKRAGYIDEPQNMRTALELSLAMLDGKDPLQFALMEKLQAKAKNAIFLERDEDFTLRGTQLNDHMDLGPNGSRGSLKSSEYVHKSVIGGHSHTFGIIMNAYQAGTFTKIRLEYNRGPSSWTRGLVVLHKDGSKQAITLVNNKWKL